MGVIEVRSDSETIASWSGNDVTAPQVTVELHRRNATKMTNTDYLGFFTGKTRAHNFVLLSSQALADFASQLIEVACNVLCTSFQQQFKARIQTVEEGSWTCACFPRQGTFVPLLFEVVVVLRIANTNPSNQGRLNSLPGP